MFHALEIRDGGGWLQMFTLWELIEIVRAPAHVPSAEEQIMLDSVQG